jgi:hypothetical protein
MWQDRVTSFLTEFDLEADTDWQETRVLKTDVAAYRMSHPNEGVTRVIFDRIVRWKLRDQIHRAADHLENLNDSMIYEVTGAAVRLQHSDIEISSRVKTEVLQGLPGVGLGVASAFLTIYFPDSFGIIDFRCWDEIHEREPGLRPIERNFTIGDYLTYLATIRPFALGNGHQVQLVDFALWKTWDLRRSRE